MRKTITLLILVAALAATCAAATRTADSAAMANPMVLAAVSPQVADANNTVADILVSNAGAPAGTQNAEVTSNETNSTDGTNGQTTMTNPAATNSEGATLLKMCTNAATTNNSAATNTDLVTGSEVAYNVIKPIDALHNTSNTAANIASNHQ